MKDKDIKRRTERILKKLKEKYPTAKEYDLDGRGKHFVCEVEPVEDHPEYDKAVEVIIESRPHKHLKMTQDYTILSGDLELHDGEKNVFLKPGDKYIVFPNNVSLSKEMC